jgi:hypothetical protein
MYPETVLDRILFATRYTRYLDKHGFLRFSNWKLYGERSLAHQPVSIWVYEGTLKIEHQAITLSKYTVELQEDHRHLRQVSHPHLAETPFRSPQLMLIDLSPDEWVLYWRMPSYVPRHRRRMQGVEQLHLFELPSVEKAVGAEGPHQEVSAHPLLQLVSKTLLDDPERDV